MSRAAKIGYTGSGLVMVGSILLVPLPSPADWIAWGSLLAVGIALSVVSHLMFRRDRLAHEARMRELSRRWWI